MARFGFDSGVQYYTTHRNSIDWSGQTWLGAGKILSISEVKETSTLSANGLRFTLTGLNPAITQSMSVENIVNRICTMWFVGIDANNLVVGWAQEFQGFVDYAQTTISKGTATLTVTVEWRLINANRPNGRRNSHADHTAEFPGDDIFKFVAKVATDASVIWPKKEFFMR